MFSFLPQLVEKFFPEAATRATRRRHAHDAEHATRRRQARFVRPRLEGLEERIVPDAYTWVGPAGGAWNVAANWLNQNNLPGVPGGMDTATVGGYCVVTNDQAVAGLTVTGQVDVTNKLSVTTLLTLPGSALNVPTNGELDVLGSADFGGAGALGGKIDTSGSTTFDPSSGMILSNGVNLIGPGTYFIYGPLTVNAALSQTTTMVLDNNNNNTFGSLTGPGSLSDNGEFDWDGGVLGLAGGATFITTADLKIQGADPKVLEFKLTNQCNASELGGTGGLLIDNGATFDNQGNPITDLSIPSIFCYASGSFINEANAFLDVDDDVTITGNFTNLGWLTTGGGSTLTLINPGSGPVAQVVDLSGTLQLNGDVIIEGAAVSSSALVQDAGAGILKIGDPSAAGTWALSGGALLSGFVEVTSSGTMTGGSVTNNGNLKLDAGSADLLASYLQTSSGTLVEEAPFAGGNTPLMVSGNAQLSGTLELDFVGGYTPASGDAFTVVSAGSISAHFDTTPDNMTVAYGPGIVTATEN
jgi:hypothetical protein